MACRTIGAFVASLFVFFCLLLIGIGFGVVISSFMAVSSGVGTTSLDSSPFSLVQNDGTGALIGGSIGAVLGLLALFGINRRALDINWLQKHGTHVVATVTEIREQRSSHSVTTGMNTTGIAWSTQYTLIAQWVNPHTGQVWLFQRSNLSLYPRNYPPGSTVEVLVDMNNPRKYFVDLK